LLEHQIGIIDYKNFYNDPTHVKPYTPISLKQTFELYNLKTIFLEPGLIEKVGFGGNFQIKLNGE
jgi:hypothetical protein